MDYFVSVTHQFAGSNRCNRKAECREIGDNSAVTLLKTVAGGGDMIPTELTAAPSCIREFNAVLYN